MVFENKVVCFLQCLLDSLRLMEYIDTVFITLYHFEYFLKVPSSNLEAMKNPLLSVFWPKHDPEDDQPLADIPLQGI